ncbi:MAG: amino acid racemase [Roseibacillus sp.]|nr:amino acid racemase [Roseibacillus sp.]
MRRHIRDYLLIMHSGQHLKTIGIAACSGPGAALCYETITGECSEILGAHHHPEIILHSLSFGEYCSLLIESDWPAIAQLLSRTCDVLVAAGADFIICPDNTVHEALDFRDLENQVPWLHIAKTVSAEAQARNFKRLAVLGTKYLMEGPVYRDHLLSIGLEPVMPKIEERNRINSIIFDRLVFNRGTKKDLFELLSIIERMQIEDQCDSVVLGCTELPLILNDQVCPLPTLDSTRLLARAAIQQATAPALKPAPLTSPPQC